jgi:hypothetical protein
MTTFKNVSNQTKIRQSTEYRGKTKIICDRWEISQAQKNVPELHRRNACKNVFA